MQSNLKILVIEDLKIAQLTAVNIFKKLHCDPTVAPTGASALDLLIFDQFDMVFLDIELPDMNGFEITKTIRNMERKKKHLPIVAVTANYFENFATKCKASGFDDYMLKPLTMESVRHMLSKHVSKQKLQENWDII